MQFARRNMCDITEEHWRPPLLPPSGRRRQQELAAAVRRFFDIQNGSIWNDVRISLNDVRGTVVDVGCGSQPYRGLLSPEVTYIGIDYAEAEEHFGYRMPDTRYYSGDIWPLADEEADLILCTETLEHVLTPDAFLAQAYRCLSPSGTLLLTVPFAARWHFIPHDYWRYTPSSLKYLLERAGFVDVAVYARGNAVTVACYKNMALILALLFPQTGGAVQLCKRLLGLVLSPLLVGLAVIANLSLRSDGGDDCLGYTAYAKHPVRADTSVQGDLAARET